MRKQLLALSLILVMLLGITAPGLRPCDAPRRTAVSLFLVGPPHLAGLSSAETEVRILSRQPPSFGPEKLA